MGAAIPWRIFCKTYGSRQNLLDTIGSILYDGKIDTGKNCYEIQPISVAPSQLKQGSFDKSGYQNAPYDINDFSIIAKDVDGNDYPTYIIYPYEGCGGDCKQCPDCFNSCVATLPYQDLINTLNCDFENIDTQCCDGMKTLWKNNWDPNNASEFLQYSAPFAINEQGNFQDAQGGKLNWCSGINYHFDIAMNQPLWANIKPNDMNGPFSQSKGDLNNIIVRYRKIPCPNPKNCKTC
jgi:hypothetical protein